MAEAHEAAASNDIQAQRAVGEGASICRGEDGRIDERTSERAEASGSEQNKTKQNKTEQSRTKLNKIEQNRTNKQEANATRKEK